MTMFVIPKSEDRATWLLDRHPHFNASSAAVLYDRHPFVTAADYAVEKLATKLVDDPPSEPMNRGRHLEAGVADWFAETMGWKLYEPDVMYGNGPLLATVDRRVHHTGSPVEIKTYSGYTDEPLPYWLDQCQAVLACTDTDTLYLVWMDASMTLQWTEVDRDEAHIADVLRRAETFMSAIWLGQVPEGAVLLAEHVTALHPEPADEVALSVEVEQMLAEFGEHRAAKKYHEEAMKEIRDVVAVALGGHAEGVNGQGEVLCSFKATKGRASFDQAGFKRDHPEMVAQYMKVGSASRRFVVPSATGGMGDE